MKIRTPKKKYRFMIGTTSRVPGSPGWHYLILDIDKKNPKLLPTKFNPFSVQETESGWHFFSNVKMRLKPMLTLAVKCGADRTWARLALKRGWAFLADKPPGIKIPWPVERKIIGWRKVKKELPRGLTGS